MSYEVELSDEVCQMIDEFEKDGFEVTDKHLNSLLSGWFDVKCKCDPALREKYNDCSNPN